MNKKHILLVSNYFPPETGAAANRMYALAVALSKAGYRVQIVCPFPNYPTGSIFDNFKGALYRKSIENELVIHRLWIWPSNSSNRFFRLLSMLSFSISLKLFFLFKKIPKKVLVQYSPIFIGFTAVLWAWIFRKKIILNISDLWPLAGLKMGLLKEGFYYSILKRMELFCCKRASLILGQSEEILLHIKKLIVESPLFLYRNYPNFNAAESKKSLATDKVRVVYAGLLGVAQGLYSICSTLLLPKYIELHLYGNGPEAEAIAGLRNPQIVFHGEISRDQLHQEIVQYDLGFVPLVNRIYGSVPSKIFEYAKLGLPIVYFAGGEGEQLVSKFNLGWNVPVNNIPALQKFISSLTLEKAGNVSKIRLQETARNAFDFQKQFDNFIITLEKV
jgi:hypothetical protein